MKRFVVIALTFMAIGLVAAFPGQRRESDESDESSKSKELLRVPISSNRRPATLAELLGQVDSSSGADDMSFPFTPFRSPDFNSVFKQMKDMIIQMREHVAASMAEQLDAANKGPFGAIPEGANTTSTVKVVGNHTVTINDTTYSKSGDHGEAVFHFRIVDVKPIEQTTENKEETESPNQSVSDVDNPDAEDKIFENQSHGESEQVTSGGSSSIHSKEDGDNEIPKKPVDIVKA